MIMHSTIVMSCSTIHSVLFKNLAQLPMMGEGFQLVTEAFRLIDPASPEENLIHLERVAVSEWIILQLLWVTCVEV
jgi:hypothetical protein